MSQTRGVDDRSAGALRRASLEGAIFGLTPAPTRRVHVPSGVVTHGVALASAGDSPFRSARIVMALFVSWLRLIPASPGARPCARVGEPANGSPGAANPWASLHARRLARSGRGVTLWGNGRRVESHDEDCHGGGSHFVRRGPATTYRPSRGRPCPGHRRATGERCDLAPGHRRRPQRTRHTNRRRVRSLVSHSGSARAGTVALDAAYRVAALFGLLPIAASCSSDAVEHSVDARL
jgi:hypothetical protein